MNINYALLGQIAVVWIIASFVTAPFIGRYLHNLRTKREFEGHLARSRECARLEKKTTVPLPRDPMKYEGRDLTPEQRRAVQTSDSRWQDNARRAEALGFMDDGSDLPRAS